MLRRFWIFLALCLAGFFGYQTYALAPAVFELIGNGVPGNAAFGASDHLPASLAVLTATFLAFVMLFFATAMVDWTAHRKILAALRDIREAHRGGGELDVRNFLTAFYDDEELLLIAADYTATLHAEGGDGGNPAKESGELRGTVPAADFFSREALVDRPLFTGLASRIPATLCGLGVLGLVLGLFEGMQRLRGSGLTAPDALVAGAQSGLVVLFAAIAMGVIAALLYHMAITARCGQTAALCQIVDALFRRGVDADYLRELARPNRGGAPDLAAAVKDLAQDIKGAIEAQNNALAAQSSVLAESARGQSDDAAEVVGGAVRSALSEPMQLIASAVERSTRDESERVRDLTDGTLNAFVVQLESSFGKQLDEVNKLLKSSRAVAADVQGAFTELAGTLFERLSAQTDAFAKELRGVIDAGTARDSAHNEALASQLEAFATALSQEVGAHSGKFGGLIAEALDRVDTVAHSATAAGSKELAKTAAVFSGLHDVVESLTRSVTPLLEQVVETQKRLSTALDDEAAAGKLIAGAATDLNSAAGASRETVDKFVDLATALSETRKALAEPPRVMADPVPAKPKRAFLDPAAAKAIGHALSQLRADTDGAKKSLPKL